MREHGGVPELDYDLHKLGWRAFQDLCAVVLQEVLGQTFTTFADTNDGGRDGAFQGRWSSQRDVPEGALEPLASGDTATVAQCKFSAGSNGTLAPSDLAPEIQKVRLLHERGLCDAYVLMTNLRVSGRTDAWLKLQLAALGVDATLVLDGAWICQQVSRNPALRRYVPRVYGLGDLGSILDDRRLRQADALIARLKDDLATFVPTAAYHQAATALSEHGFALLLGEPACGKSTIAAVLSVAALDNWGCGVKRVDSASELVEVWDPDDPSQLFWVDDAFGAIRHDAALTDGWIRRMDQVMTAIAAGARLILTSRDYVYRDARPHLKEYAYPLLRENQVVIDVSALTISEKRQMLYNHLKAGDQPRRVLESWVPHLPGLADISPFPPEVARRLAHKAFTATQRLETAQDLQNYFGNPTAFLTDILKQLDRLSFAALACVYITGSELPAPVQFSSSLSDVVSRLGADVAGVNSAFSSMDGTFLQQSLATNGDPVWRFRHPSIREAFARVVADDINTVNVFLGGLSPSELIAQVDCGGAHSRGDLVRVPESLFEQVIRRVALPSHQGLRWSNPTARFLEDRCSDVFLRAWAAYRADELGLLLNFGMSISAHWQPSLLARLHDAGALPEEIREAAVAKISEFALLFDPGWLSEPVRHLLTMDERSRLLDRVRDEVIPVLTDEIDQSADGWDADTAPAERYAPALEVVTLYEVAFSNEPGVLDELRLAKEHIESEIAIAEHDFVPRRSTVLSSAAAPRPVASAVGRNEFDDVAEGR